MMRPWSSSTIDNDLLKMAENSAASITNSYNSVNRLTNVVTVAGPVTSEVSYTYFPQVRSPT